MTVVDDTDAYFEPKEPIVVSSFYPSPDGLTSIRAYEIKNSNPNIVKIRKEELDEPRFENNVSSAFGKFISFFIGTDNSNSNSQTNSRNSFNSSDNINVKKGMAYHTKRDGGIVAVTSLDLSNHHGDNSALREFVQRKAMVDRMNNSYKPTQMTNQTAPNGNNITPRFNNTKVQAANNFNNINRINNAPTSPCMCIDCQAKNRRGQPYGTFDCFCLDCQNKRKMQR